ncbi:hypothetical protein [Fulvimarina sp. MAC8]
MAAPWGRSLVLAFLVVLMAALSFGAVSGWLAYGEAIFLTAVAEGWALCF